MTEPANWQVAQGSTAEHCLEWPTVGHSMTTHMRGGALVSVSRCTGCGWIDFADLDEQVRSLPDKTLDLLGDAWGLVCNAGWDASSGRVDLEKTEGWHEAALRLREHYHAALRGRYGSSDERDTPRAAAERAAWTRDIARMLREQTGVFSRAPELRAGYLAAADWLDPADETPVREDPAANAAAYRLGEQREALHGAREIFRSLDVDNDPGLAFAIGAGATNNIRMWMDRFGKLADPPMVVEVEDDDESDDAPATVEPGAGESSGRWRPLGTMTDGGEVYWAPDHDEPAGAAHLDFAEDAARRARGRCVNDTDGDGNCPACARNPDAPCRQVPDA
jgi:hypothetical protein